MSATDKHGDFSGHDLVTAIREAGREAAERGLPRVSDLTAQLRDLSAVPTDRLEAARQRGSAVHARIDKFGLTDALVDFADYEIAGYCASALSYTRADFAGRLMATELPVGDLILARGTIDRLEEVDAKTCRVVDWKTGSRLYEVNHVQVALYSRLIRPIAEAHGWRVLPPMLVHLKRDGKPCVCVETAHDYEHLTDAMLRIHRWRWANDSDYKRGMVRRHEGEFA